MALSLATFLRQAGASIVELALWPERRTHNATSILLLLQMEAWRIVAGVAVFCSQILIIQSWIDARSGTIANIAIAILAVIMLFSALPSDQQNHLHPTEKQKDYTP